MVKARQDGGSGGWYWLSGTSALGQWKWYQRTRARALRGLIYDLSQCLQPKHLLINCPTLIFLYIFNDAGGWVVGRMCYRDWWCSWFNFGISNISRAEHNGLHLPILSFMRCSALQCISTKYVAIVFSTLQCSPFTMQWSPSYSAAH